ncbi:hypothetical protein [Phycicoccus avicenniae]|uniref:hypothetical protein n=1 Tax=Phycicoccus avicenniae TaxID=2828860 RepID=UPI003D2E7837
MNATAQVRAYPVCPDWCTDHQWPQNEDEGDLHMATDRRGASSSRLRPEWLVGIGFSADTGESHDAPIDCANVDQLTPAQARALARALLDAAAEVEASWAVEAAREALRGQH